MLALWWLLACGPSDPPTEEPGLADNFGVAETEGDDDCDNLADGHCMMPFPSDVWRDPSTGRLALSDDATPEGNGGRLSVDGFTQDGFGLASPVLFQLPGAVVPGGPFDTGPSRADGPTVMIDAATGARIPHWLETDWLDEAQDPPVLTLRASVPLPAGARIVVGVRGLRDAAGDLVPAPEGFRALRDAEASTRVGVHARRARYEEGVFPVLAAAGVARDELQLAWDFTTRTTASAEADLAAVREVILDALDPEGPTYTIDLITETPEDPSIALIVDGTAQIPSVLGPPDAQGVRRLRRDAGGRPVVEGTESIAFRLQVPHSAYTGDGPAAVLQYGHGFLGSRNEANNGWLRNLAQQERFLILAADMQGMSSPNSLIWTAVLLQDAGRINELADEPMQGVINHIALQEMMAGRFTAEADPRLQRDGQPLYDPGQFYYHGNSQGGTMGTLVLAMSDRVRRGVLGVPGCCFPFLLHRSVVFSDLSGLLAAAYPEPGDLSLILALLGTAWDRLDGFTWAPRVVDPLPGVPAHQALLHVALEDAQVQNDASWMLARAIGAVQPRGQVAVVEDVPEVDLPIEAPAVVVNYDFGVPPDATPLDPPVAGTDTHGVLRADPLAWEQLAAFFRTGVVEDVCDGPCVRPR